MWKWCYTAKVCTSVGGEWSSLVVKSAVSVCLFFQRCVIALPYCLHAQVNIRFVASSTPPCAVLCRFLVILSCYTVFLSSCHAILFSCHLLLCCAVFLSSCHAILFSCHLVLCCVVCCLWYVISLLWTVVSFSLVLACVTLMCKLLYSTAHTGMPPGCRCCACLHSFIVSGLIIPSHRHHGSWFKSNCDTYIHIHS